MSDTDTSNRIGRHMLILAWMIGLGMLGLFFSGILDKRHNPNQSITTEISTHGQRVVILQRNHQGHYVASGAINDYPVTFLLDTGATIVSIPEHVATRLGLTRGAESYTQTANGMIKTYATRLNSISIGDIRMGHVAAHINPHFDGEEVLLGMSFLKNLELIQRGNTLTIRQ